MYLLNNWYLHVCTFPGFLNDIVLSYHIEMIYEQRHEISNNVVCATSKASDQPAHKRSLIRASASRLTIV